MQSLGLAGVVTSRGDARFDEAVRTCKAMVATYTVCGHGLIELPLASVTGRLRFVLAQAGLDR